MSKTIAVTALMVFVVLQACASPCPVMLVSGVGNPYAFILTLRDAGKLPIRTLEFNCNPVRAQTGKGRRTSCREQNALFYPGTEYTARYPYPGGVRQPVIVSLKSATLSNGYVWKPTKREPCRTLRISPGRTKK